MYFTSWAASCATMGPHQTVHGAGTVAFLQQFIRVLCVYFTLFDYFYWVEFGETDKVILYGQI